MKYMRGEENSMKTWVNPEMNELKINGTEYFALKGEIVDGYYTSNDGKYKTPTYSGSYTKDVPFEEA